MVERSVASSLGSRAEQAVATYLEQKGWRIVGRNITQAWGEIDIVAQDRGVLVCVEVKAGYAREGFTPEDHFDPRKRTKVARACHAYALRHGFSDTECRVDLAAVVVDSVRGSARVHYYKNAGN